MAGPGVFIEDSDDGLTAPLGEVRNSHSSLPTVIFELGL